MDLDAYPILEFDGAGEAILEPTRLIRRRDVPEACVLTFFADLIRGLQEAGKLRVAATMRSEIGEHPLYEMDVDGQRLGVCHPGMGGPLAAGLLEELIAFGCCRFIACGGAGVLNRDIAVGHLIVPTSAVRDEGTSYHYLPPSREVSADPAAVEVVCRVLEEHGISYIRGKTWTTDAIYRETPDKVALRRSEGCVTVEMEAASFFAVSTFRSVRFAQILYAGDDVSGAAWDARARHSRSEVRQGIFQLAVEACLALT